MPKWKIIPTKKINIYISIFIHIRNFSKLAEPGFSQSKEDRFSRSRSQSAPNVNINISDTHPDQLEVTRTLVMVETDNRLGDTTILPPPPSPFPFASRSWCRLIQDKELDWTELNKWIFFYYNANRCFCSKLEEMLPVDQVWFCLFFLYNEPGQIHSCSPQFHSLSCRVE